ncbi:unnamed protein product [Merluccius merluccius]
MSSTVAGSLRDEGPADLKTAQLEAQKATQEFQRAVEILRAAKETIALAEERLLEEDSRQFDSAWQEMLNHATQRVMEAEQARTRSEAEHKKTAANYNSCIGHMKQLEKKLKRNINKSRPYFELKAKYYLQLEQLKRRVDERQTKLALAKAEYRTALGNLETISEEIHAQRRSLTAATRERGVGSDGDGDNEDITNFKMESDGLSMLSMSMDGEGGHSASSEEETDSSPSSSSSSSSPLEAPSTTSSSSPSSTSSASSPSSPSSPTSHPHPSARPRPSTNSDAPCPFPSSPSLFGPGPFLSTSPSPISCSCPGPLELPCASEADGPDSVCDSGHDSPVLGPRSQCSGASSPDCDCDQERGDRAEGAEAAVEAGLNKLTLTAARADERQEDERRYPADPQVLPPTPAAAAAPPVLLLNSV